MTRKQITTTIDEKLLEDIKIQAVKEGTSVNVILERLIEKYLKEKGAL